MKIFVGNLSYLASEEDLRREFAAFGSVGQVNIVTDKYDHRPKGFAFVEMLSKSEAQAAIAGLNGKALHEKPLTINEARPKSDSRGTYGSRSNERTRSSGGGQSSRGNRSGRY